MPIKIYSMNNVNDAIIPMTLGKTTIKVEFKNGIALNNKPAQYRTSNPVHQFIIEKNSLFGTQIKLVDTIALPTDVALPEAAPKTQTNLTPTPSANDNQKGEVIESITNLNELVAELHKRGVDKRTLTTKAKIMASAEQMKIYVPNLN